MLKKILITALCSTLFVLGAGYWLMGLVPPAPDQQLMARTQVEDIPYLQQSPSTNDRGRVLIVVTSTATMGKSGKKTGYEFTELTRPYYVLRANGFEVDIASPQGGEPPAVMDKDDMGPFDYAFLNDIVAMKKLRNSIALVEVEAEQYRGVFFAGGKGAMFDFPGNPEMQNLVASIHSNKGVIGAVCHGPAALVDITLDTGTRLLQGRRVSSFTNEEELFLIPDAEQVFPFLLESRLRSNGAIFEAGPPYLRQVSIDDRLVTGQNPWSSWQVTEAMVKALGYQPVARAKTDSERTVEVLLAYERAGYTGGAAKIEDFFRLENGEQQAIDRRLLAMHGIVAVMQGQLGKALSIVRLLSLAKKLQHRE
ncbi:type 1 glutamine amidotransferase domain-containing protein [Microbulbifer sp. SH-1]|uniref:type 1 glutamine amidotransferase domain-containing protein n=1 Tax=Microbulbifer sp. SH-1 TaxID=2681547 RepID=UPI0014094715|nr:type 1 glutamine amidotransferase domain-containing protein [Microbulbifer sp. SH-1]QIL90334.1 type 1 glutamine amidotransferase domain-containing protein [Microbulbifer sp. SH-1]